MPLEAIIGLVLTILGMLGGGAYGLIRMTGDYLDRRFARLEASIDGHGEARTSMRAELYAEIRRLEVELHDYKYHVSENYVHREDYVRVEASRDIKLERLSAKIDELTTLIFDRLNELRAT